MSGLPEALDTPALRRHFERFGDVVHVGVALANRQLIQAMEKRAGLLSAVEDAALALLRALHAAREQRRQDSQHAALRTVEVGSGDGGESGGREGTSADADTSAALGHAVRAERRALDRAVAKLHAFDGTVQRLSRQTHKCTGVAFVTFNSTASAKAAKLDGGSAPFETDALMVPISIEEAPPPDQVLWENLAVGPHERLARQCVSTAILLVFSILGELSSDCPQTTDCPQLAIRPPHRPRAEGYPSEDISSSPPNAPPSASLIAIATRRRRHLRRHLPQAKRRRAAQRRLRRAPLHQQLDALDAAAHAARPLGHRRERRLRRAAVCGRGVRELRPPRLTFDRR